MTLHLTYMSHHAQLTTEHPDAVGLTPILLLGGVPYKPADMLRWRGEPTTAWQFVSEWQTEQNRLHDERTLACDAFLRPS